MHTISLAEHTRIYAEMRAQHITRAVLMWQEPIDGELVYVPVPITRRAA